MDADQFDYLSADEVSKLLAWTQKHQPDEFPLYATAVYTGMRMGELFGLRRVDVDLETASSLSTSRIPIAISTFAAIASGVLGSVMGGLTR